MKKILRRFLTLGICTLISAAQAAETTKVLSLDGDGWLLAPDPQRVGLEQKWWEQSRSEAKVAKVPGTIQDVFPGYSGYAWYWYDLAVGRLPDRDPRKRQVRQPGQRHEWAGGLEAIRRAGALSYPQSEALWNLLCHAVETERNRPPPGRQRRVRRGPLGRVCEYTFPQVYPKDEWVKRHPLFDGLPCGGLMDYTFYRDIIPDYRYWGQDLPEEAVAGAFRTSCPGHHSELMLSVYKLGQGHFILNALRIRQALGRDPAAESLLRNLLRYAARNAAQPLAKLPADFEEKLNALGY
ncbi:MAG: hypothetical protein JXB10_02185 [Pirellulales bacterium]|nr:hypothetical protein [Pirellulales bacterium]